MFERRTILAGLAALPVAAMVPIGITSALAAGTTPTGLPAFDAAAYVNDLRLAGCSVIAGPTTYFIGLPQGRGAGRSFEAVRARWSDSTDACPDHVERVMAYLADEAVA